MCESQGGNSIGKMLVETIEVINLLQSDGVSILGM